MVFFRQHEDRLVSQQICTMKWNSVIDLLAVGLKNGDVCVHRLINWQRIWTLSWSSNDPNDSKIKTKFTDLKVNGIEWRPDGKVLAVGYNKNVRALSSLNNDCSIALVDVENGDVIYVILIEDSVSCLCWKDKVDFTPKEYNINWSNDYIDKITPLSRSATAIFSKEGNETSEDLMKLYTDNSLNILVVGTKSGNIYIYSFGIFLIGFIAIQNPVRIEYIYMSSDFGLLNVLLSKKFPSIQSENETDSKRHYFIQSYRLPSFKHLSGQYFIISNLYCKIISLRTYLSDSMKALQEILEDVLLEIDSRLSNFMQIKSEPMHSSTIVLYAEEFLELLVIGNATDSLEKFLHELGEKGLKNLGNSIETTYTNMQKLVVSNIEKACKHIFLYLHILRAISLWETEFHQIGFNTSDINKALKALASFYLKSLEFQHVIDSSIQNVQCFFRWLYSVILRIYSDSIPTSQQDAVKLSQQDLQHVADFIQENFESTHTDQEMAVDGSKKNPRPTASNFTLEKVSQYLRSGPLSSVATEESLNSPWLQYLKEMPQLTSPSEENELILYSHNPQTSLAQEHSNMIENIEIAFKNPFTKFIQNNDREPHPLLSFVFSFYNEGAVSISHISDINKRFCYSAFIKNLDMDVVVIIRYSLDNDVSQQAEITTVVFDYCDDETNKIKEMKAIDLQFYDENVLSLLLMTTQNHNYFLTQFPIRLIDNYVTLLNKTNFERIENQVRIQIGAGSEIHFRKLESFRPVSLVVDGSRKVACLASASKRRVKIFEMDEVEEEVEEDNDNTDT